MHDQITGQGHHQETLFTSCTGVVLQECVQPQGSIPGDEMNEVHVYMIMMYVC